MMQSRPLFRSPSVFSYRSFCAGPVLIFRRGRAGPFSLQARCARALPAGALCRRRARAESERSQRQQQRHDSRLSDQNRGQERWNEPRTFFGFRFGHLPIDHCKSHLACVSVTEGDGGGHRVEPSVATTASPVTASPVTRGASVLEVELSSGATRSRPCPALD